MMEHELVCIQCPQGCNLVVRCQDSQIREVVGNRCRRGINYAQTELFNPTRILTTTVRIKNGVYPVLPVKTKYPIPKKCLLQAIQEVNSLIVNAPVAEGMILINDIANTGVPVVATRSMKLKCTAENLVS